MRRVATRLLRRPGTAAMAGLLVAVVLLAVLAPVLPLPHYARLDAARGGTGPAPAWRAADDSLAALRRDDRPVAVHELRTVLPDPEPEPEPEGVAEPARRLGDVRVGEDRDDGGIRDGAVPDHGALAAQASISLR